MRDLTYDRQTLCLIKLIYRSNALILRICTYKNEAKCGPLKPSEKKKKIVIEVDPCDLNQCQLPFCYCSRTGDVGPLDEDPKFLPQLVMLTFDGAVNLNNFPHYDRLLKIKHGEVSIFQRSHV